MEEVLAVNRGLKDAKAKGEQRIGQVNLALQQAFRVPIHFRLNNWIQLKHRELPLGPFVHDDPFSLGPLRDLW